MLVLRMLSSKLKKNLSDSSKRSDGTACGMVFRLIAPFSTVNSNTKVRRSDYGALGRKSGLKVTENEK